MSLISKVKLHGVEYDLKDAEARALLNTKQDNIVIITADISNNPQLFQWLMLFLGGADEIIPWTSTHSSDLISALESDAAAKFNDIITNSKQGIFRIKFKNTTDANADVEFNFPLDVYASLNTASSSPVYTLMGQMGSSNDAQTHPRTFYVGIVLAVTSSATTISQIVLSTGNAEEIIASLFDYDSSISTPSYKLKLSHGGTGLSANDADNWYTSNTLHPHFTAFLNPLNATFTCQYQGPLPSTVSSISDALATDEVQYALKQPVPVIIPMLSNRLIGNGLIDNYMDFMDSNTSMRVLFTDWVYFNRTFVNGINGTLTYTSTDGLFLDNVAINRPKAIDSTTGAPDIIVQASVGDLQVGSASVPVYWTGSRFAETAAIPTVPTNVSAFNNDSGFLTASDNFGAIRISSDAQSVPANAESISPNNTIILNKIAKTGSYTDLFNKPTKISAFTNDSGYITSAGVATNQIQPDWNATSGKGQILNKPTLATVATSGSYNDLSNIPDDKVQIFTATATEDSLLGQTIFTLNCTLTEFNNAFNSKIVYVKYPNAQEEIEIRQAQTSEEFTLGNFSGYQYELTPITEVDMDGGITVKGQTMIFLSSNQVLFPWPSSKQIIWSDNAELREGVTGKLNDNIVVDENYNHTDNNFTNNLKTKLENLEIPTNVSTFNNDANYINQTQLNTAIGNINSFNVSIVTSFPTSNIDTHTIYFISNSGSGQNIYDEYMYLNNKWEKIGTTDVDLSGYLTSSDFTNVSAYTSGGTVTQANFTTASITPATFANVTASKASAGTAVSVYKGGGAVSQTSFTSGAAFTIAEGTVTANSAYQGGGTVSQTAFTTQSITPYTFADVTASKATTQTAVTVHTGGGTISQTPFGTTTTSHVNS